jgi:hypothetical protein
MGYVMGVSEYGQVVKTLCYPNNFINSQAFDLVLNYLKSKPEKRTDPSLLIVINALKSAFAIHEQGASICVFLRVTLRVTENKKALPMPSSAF